MIRPLRAMALVAIAALLAGACGDDSTSSDATDGPPADGGRDNTHEKDLVHCFREERTSVLPFRVFRR